MKNFLVFVGFVLAFFKLLFAQEGQVVRASFISPSLSGEKVHVDVYLPVNHSSTVDPYRVLIYLHGASSGPTIPYSQGFKPQLDELIGDGITGKIDPIVVVWPRVPGGEYLNDHEYLNSEYYMSKGKYYGDVIVKDLLEWLENPPEGEQNFNVSSDRTKRAIGGHSMGGDYSLRLAILNCEKFGAVVSHGGGPSMRWFLEWTPYVIDESEAYVGFEGAPYFFTPHAGFFNQIYYAFCLVYSPNLENPPYYVDFILDSDTGEVIKDIEDRWMEYDIAKLITDPEIYTSPVKIYFDVGYNDQLNYFGCEYFHADLTNAGIEHTYIKLPGEHWAGVDNAESSLTWLDAAMDDYITHVDGEQNVMVTGLTLEPNYPNPFNTATIIEYALPMNANIEITIVDMLGRKIRSLVSGIRSAGTHHVIWNGLDNTDSPVASGVYFYTMTAEGFSETRKLLLIR